MLDRARRRRTAAVALALAAAAALIAVAPRPAVARPTTAALARDRVDAAAKLYTRKMAAWRAGTATLDQVHGWSVRWLTAQREQPLTGKAWKQALADHVARMTELERVVAAAVDAGIAGPLDRDEAAYYRIEAELWQARNKLP